MTRQFWALAAVGSLALAGCATDPTSSLQGTPTRIQSSASIIQLNQGDSALVTAATLDAQGVPLATTPTATSGDPTIVTVSDASQPPLSQARFYVKGIEAGAGNVTVSAGGVSTDVTVIVFPTTFSGAVSVNTAGRLDTVTVASSAAVTFDTTASEVFIDGGATLLISRSATELKVLALSKDPLTDATVTITNAILLVGTENESDVAELDASTTVSISGEPSEPNDSMGQAEAITSGTTITGSVGDSDASDYYSIVLAAPGTITMSVEFGGPVDIDTYLYMSDGTEVNHSWFDNPEVISEAVPAGTYFLEVNLYDSGGDPVPNWYTMTVTVS